MTKKCGMALNSPRAMGKFCVRPKGHNGQHRSEAHELRRRAQKRAFRVQHPLNATWYGMKQRCLNPAHDNYRNYGARGITIYPPWIDSFPAFEAWILDNLGPRPEGMTLDRIDNDGNYEPGNLQWATAEEQLLNRRNVADLRCRIAELEAENIELRSQLAA